MEDFTPMSGFAGGLLIGSAVALMLLLNGRVAGISSIVGGLLTLRLRDAAWRAAFVAGLIIGALAYLWTVDQDRTTPVRVLASLPAILVGGLLVGFGTRLGSGCTSGHGLCGMARLSRRSVVSTATFFGVAMLTVFVTRHVL
ncbi:MAG TPA: YeeE/YedE family protein [Rubrobacter sp.]|nr:YeeE/YedE family protein [Rubrobacter sp.]